VGIIMVANPTGKGNLLKEYAEIAKSPKKQTPTVSSASVSVRSRLKKHPVETLSNTMKAERSESKDRPLPESDENL
jgi:hypothetical protein